jgi:hypothetical protein
VSNIIVLVDGQNRNDDFLGCEHGVA